MTQKLHILSIVAFATMLLASPLASSPIAFADDEDEDDEDERQRLTELQKKCQKDPKNPIKIKAECELLNIINDLKDDQATKNAQIDALIAELQAKDEALMTKDSQLDAKDSALMAKDDELMNEDNAIKKRVNVNSRLAGAVCDNVPFMRDALGLISQTTSAAIASIVSIGDFQFAAAMPIPAFTTGNVIPTVSADFKTTDPCDTFDRVGDLLGFNPNCEFTYVKKLNFGTTSVSIDVPDPSFDLGKPFAPFINVLQQNNVLPAADSAVTSILNCDPDSLRDIDAPLPTV